MNDARVLDRLHGVILERRGADPKGSRTARLFAAGIPKIAQKVGEEAVETVIEGVREDRGKLATESADLLYHLLVLWAATGLKPETVWEELDRRAAAGGLDVKEKEKR